MRSSLILFYLLTSIGAGQDVLLTTDDLQLITETNVTVSLQCRITFNGTRDQLNLSCQLLDQSCRSNWPNVIGALAFGLAGCLLTLFVFGLACLAFRIRYDFNRRPKKPKVKKDPNTVKEAKSIASLGTNDSWEKEAPIFPVGYQPKLID